MKEQFRNLEKQLREQHNNQEKIIQQQVISTVELNKSSAG